MNDKAFNPTSLSKLSEVLASTGQSHVYLGFCGGVGAALDIIRDHVPASHPMRKAVFQLLMDVTEKNVTDIMKANAARREERLKNGG